MDRKPGRPRALTVDAIAHAALEDGIATFSMPSVARRLGVAHSGLYRYVTDRDDLLVRAMDIAFDSTTWPDGDAGLPWTELLQEIGHAVWRACDAYPGLDRACQLAPRPSPVLLARMDPWIRSLNDQHFLLEDAAVSVEFVISLALDCSGTMAQLSGLQRSLLSSADIPMLKAFDTDEVWVGRGLYDRKLDVFLTGLEARRIAE
jgi:AcrR family transcriptional regulator